MLCVSAPTMSPVASLFALLETHRQVEREVIGRRPVVLDVERRV